MPALPEFGNILAYERMLEVFVKVEAENSSETDGNVGISREIKIYLQAVSNNAVPCAKHSRASDVSEETVCNYAELICQQHLFTETQSHSVKTV